MKTIKRKSIIIHHFIDMSYFNYFTSKEFMPSCNPQEVYECLSKGYFDNVLTLIQVLDSFREFCDYPIKITSSYRGVEHNRRVKGSSTSQHLYGGAIDFYLVNVPWNTAVFLFQDFLRKSALERFLGQVIFYHKRNFIHIGLRTQAHKQIQFLHYEKGNN